MVELKDLKINDPDDLYVDTITTYKEYFIALEELKNPKKEKYVLLLLDCDNNILDSWETSTNYLDLPIKDFKASKDCRKFFEKVDNLIKLDDDLINYDYDYDFDAQHDFNADGKKSNSKHYQLSWDDYISDYPISWKTNYISKEEAFEKYNKSKTLCIHKSDPTTTMLSQIYEGKGWDVITDPHSISKDVLNDLIDAHDRIVMLGHGTGYGLIGSIGPEQAPHLKDKKLFALWCNADSYCNRYLSGKTGFFACGNMPSDDHEALAVGFKVSHKYMDDNITYWCKLCGDVVEKCLEGNAKEGCKYIRDEYWKKYGHSEDPDEKGITAYNYQRTKVAGEGLIPLPE